jgi:hypothetical protein
MSNESPEFLTGQFKRFAQDEVHDSSPLYERLSAAVAEDPEFLALAAYARKGERVPNLFFAAVHYLLLKGKQRPLSAFYRSIHRRAGPKQDPYPAFRSFCLEEREEIINLISRGRVQTNDVSRCGFLLPAFVVASQVAHPQPLYLIEIGASAGLNLLWDRYCYTYGDAHRAGDLKSPVQIKCALRGAVLPPIARTTPEMLSRVGVDLNPIDVRDADASLCLGAFIWPEHEERAGLLTGAIALAQRAPPTLIGGDAAELIPSFWRGCPRMRLLASSQLSPRFLHEHGKHWRRYFPISAQRGTCFSSPLGRAAP